MVLDFRGGKYQRPACFASTATGGTTASGPRHFAIEAIGHSDTARDGVSQTSTPASFKLETSIEHRRTFRIADLAGIGNRIQPAVLGLDQPVGLRVGMIFLEREYGRIELRLIGDQDGLPREDRANPRTPVGTTITPASVTRTVVEPEQWIGF